MSPYVAWMGKQILEEQQSMAGEAKLAGTEITALQEADRKRRRQALELQRERVLSERTSSPHRRSALENALADIEEKLAELGWTVHL